MNLEQVKKIIEQKESTTVEFKTSTKQLKSAFETVFAFLNGKGGTVLLGVKDNGQIVGQEITDNTRQEIAREKKRIEPAPPVDVDYIEVKENKFVIVIRVNTGNHIPYTYDGRAFQRNESQTDRMSQHLYEQLLIKRGQLNHSWETFIAKNYTINDLDKDEIYLTVMDGIAQKRIPATIAKESTEKILRQLNLTSDKKLKRASVILFGKETESEYPQCWLKMARFQGTDKSGNFIDNQQAHSNAFQR
jgi:ATP-dependent DNA helicase RecG